MAAGPHHIDPTAYLEELLTQASPDLMRQMLGRVDMMGASGHYGCCPFEDR